MTSSPNNSHAAPSANNESQVQRQITGLIQRDDLTAAAVELLNRRVHWLTAKVLSLEIVVKELAEYVKQNHKEYPKAVSDWMDEQVFESSAGHKVFSDQLNRT